MATNYSTSAPNGDAAAADISASAATGEATTNTSSSDAKASAATTADAPKTDAKTEVVETPFDTVASSKAWTVPAVSVKETEENTAAIELQNKEAAKRAADPNMVITREPVEGVGGESFNVGTVEATETLADKVKREDDAQLREDANRIVFRTPDKRIGGTSLEVG